MTRVVFPCDQENWGMVKDKLYELKEISLQDDCDLATLAEAHQAVYNLNIGLDDTDEIHFGNTLFYGLVKFLRKHASPEERQHFLQFTLPSIIDQATRIEDLLPPDGIAINKQQHAETVPIERMLCVSILACGFLCLFTGEDRGRGKTPNAKLNEINFHKFFANLPIPSQNAKLRCILNFFDRVTREWNRLTGQVTFTRQVLKADVLPSLDTWLNCSSDLCQLIVHHTGVIEDAGCNVLEVDFANRYIGGGVLVRGRLQEEIRFTVCPELIVSMLFMEVMEENEAIIIQGFEQFSSTEGYAAGLQFAGDYVDTSEVDEASNLRHMLCAIDAVDYRYDQGDTINRQYTDQCVLRDINKAYAGFCTEFKLPVDTELRRLLSEEEYFTANESDKSEENGLEPSTKYKINMFVEDVISQAMSIAIPDAVHHIGGLPSNVNIESIDDPAPPGCELEDSFQSHSTTNSADEEVPMNHLEVNFRDWLAHYRRRSSNLSDISSRRSSYDSRRSSYDLASRRSSASRMSSEFSSEFEEYFENFQHQEPEYKFHTIKEEVGGSLVNEFAASLALSLLQTGTHAAARVGAEVQEFHNEQPMNVVAKPHAVNPQDLASIRERVVRHYVDRLFTDIWPFLTDEFDCDNMEKKMLRNEIDSYLYPEQNIPHESSDGETVGSHVVSDNDSDLSGVELADREVRDEANEAGLHEDIYATADRIVAKAFDEALLEYKYECLSVKRMCHLSRESSQSEHSSDSRSQLDLSSSPNLHNTDQSSLFNKVDLHNCDKSSAAVAEHVMLEIFMSVSNDAGKINSMEAVVPQEGTSNVPPVCDKTFASSCEVDLTESLEENVALQEEFNTGANSNNHNTCKPALFSDQLTDTVINQSNAQESLFAKVDQSNTTLLTGVDQSNNGSSSSNSSRSRNSVSEKMSYKCTDASNNNFASSQTFVKLPSSHNSAMSSSSVENTTMHLVDGSKRLKCSPNITPKKHLSSDSDSSCRHISGDNSNSNNSAGSEQTSCKQMKSKSLSKSSSSHEENKVNLSPRSSLHTKNGRCVTENKGIKKNFDQFAKCLSRDLLTHAFLDAQDSGDTVIFSRRSSEPIQISNGVALQRLENSHPTVNGKRTQMSKTDEDIGKFAEELTRHGATCEVDEDFRRGSSGFRDPVMSRFAEELMKVNVSVPTLTLTRGPVSSSSSTSVSVCSTASSFRDPLLSNFEAELLGSSLGKSSAKTQTSWSKMRVNSYSPRRSNSLGLPRKNNGRNSDRGARRFNSLSFDSEHSGISWKSIGITPGEPRPSNLSEFAEVLSQRIMQEVMTAMRRRTRSNTNNSAFCNTTRRTMTFDDYCNALTMNILKSAMAEVKVRQVCSDWLEQNKMVTWSNETEHLVYSGEESYDSDVVSQVSEGSLSDRSQDRISSLEYEDALDVPFTRLEQFANIMADRVLLHSVAMYNREKESGLRRQYGRPIATGNWGCGAFNGDPHLKSLLQWMAASYAGTPCLLYYSFNHHKMTQFQEVVDTVLRRGWTVSSLMRVIRRYCIMSRRQMEQQGHMSHDLFDIILQGDFGAL